MEESPPATVNPSNNHQNTVTTMHIELNDLNELKELMAAIVKTETQPTAPNTRDLGTQIIVADRGFVYVGNVTLDGDFATVNNARNIRKWGTTNGLGELVNGPTSSTIVDPCGTVLLPIKAIIHFISCKSGW